MVPPSGIEPLASPLPRARSTPELRRRTRRSPYAIGVVAAQDDQIGAKREWCRTARSANFPAEGRRYAPPNLTDGLQCRIRSLNLNRASAKKAKKPRLRGPSVRLLFCVRTCSNAKYSSVAGRPTGPTGMTRRAIAEGFHSRFESKDTRA